MPSGFSRAVRRVVLAVLVAACGSDGAAPAPAKPMGDGPDASASQPPDLGPDPPPAPPPSDQLPCPKSPCTARPILFLHGHTGGIRDGVPTLDAMKAAGERFDDWRSVGTKDHQAWEPRSIPRRSWGFDFDYYLEHAATEKQGTYTAGPGRVGTGGHICASAAAYDQGSQHEFAKDLAELVDSVLRATGMSQVDIVTHSMGGLVTRSFITFLGGADKVHTVLFLATPHLGVSFAAGEASFNANDQPWMTAHELAELDRNTLLPPEKFMRCGDSTTDTWPKLLLGAETKLPKLPEYHCMRGDKDPIVDNDSAHHPSCKDFQLVPGAGHGDLPYTKEAVSFGQRTVGGFVTTSTKL